MSEANDPLSDFRAELMEHLAYAVGVEFAAAHTTTTRAPSLAEVVHNAAVEIVRLKTLLEDVYPGLDLPRLHRFLVAHGKAKIGLDDRLVIVCVGCLARSDSGGRYHHAPDCEWVALVAMTKGAA